MQEKLPEQSKYQRLQSGKWSNCFPTKLPKKGMPKGLQRNRKFQKARSFDDYLGLVLIFTSCTSKLLIALCLVFSFVIWALVSFHYFNIMFTHSYYWSAKSIVHGPTKKIEVPTNTARFKTIKQISPKKSSHFIISNSI